MTIQEQNIVFVRSQVMDDVPEGGGAATGTVIPDGVMNNVFEDISDLDRAYGRFNLRKLFLAVRTLSTDLYAGAKTVITQRPIDAALGYTLFSTGDPFDVRTDAARRVEAYLYKGPMWHGALQENHIAGMRALSLIQRVDTVLPPIGKTLCLVQDEGLAGEKEQYVRVIDTAAVLTTFEDDKGEYQRWIVRLDLSDALRHDFAGHTVNRYDNYNYTGKTRLRNTTVADATRYYSSQPLTLAADIGDLTVRAASLFTQLVPSAQTETPLSNQVLMSGKLPIVASRTTSLTYTLTGAAIAPNGVLSIESGFLPGSVNVTLSGVPLTDDGQGGAWRNGVAVGQWNYATGECAFYANAPTVSGTATVVYQPAVAVSQQAHTRSTIVTAENRRLNWLDTLAPTPAPQSLDVTWRSQGNWYTLTDNGQGGVIGTDALYGSGTVSYVTGAVAVTLGALPDVDSPVIFTWGSPVHYTPLVAPDADTAEVTLYADQPIRPNTVTVTWQVGAQVKTATDNGAGVLSGDAGGRVAYANRRVTIWPSPMPDQGADVVLDYEADTVDLVNNPPTNTVATGRAIAPNTVRLGVQFGFPNGELVDGVVNDNGVGGLRVLTPPGSQYVEMTSRRWTLWVGDAVGTVNYATGLIILNVTTPVSERQWNIAGQFWSDLAPVGVATLALITVASVAASANGTATAESTPFGSVGGLAPAVTVAQGDAPMLLVPNSLVLSYGGKRYVDRNGVLYTNVLSNGSGTPAGSVDYTRRTAQLTVTAPGASGVPLVLAALGQKGEFSTQSAVFRTGVSPVKPESLQLTAQTLLGVTLSATADPDGVIAGTGVSGDFDYDMGAGTVAFAEPVYPGSLRYNAVAYRYIPLDADLLGIDAVRLPSDGRVPIYRAGDVVMILHTDTITGTPAQVGGTGPYRLSCGRTRLAWVKITDANDAPVTEGYTLDRAAGTLSWESLAGLATPVTVQHTIGDLRLVTDAQINGQLTLARPLSHAFPANDSLVAACLIHGDRRARVAAVWDQASWNSVWSDVLAGSAATATLNTIDFPITVTNEGCDTDRWLLRWLSTTSVELISEKRGLVWTGAWPAYVSGDPSNVAPINPRTLDENGQNGTPYLMIDQRANGGGWSAGNVVRINTVGAMADFWIARSIAQSDAPEDDGADGCEIYALGNIDRP